MSRTVRKRLLGTIELLGEGVNAIDRMLQRQQYEMCIALLSDCQELAIALGTRIEALRGLDTKTVSALEQFCEVIYQVGEVISAVTTEGNHRSEETELINELRRVMDEVRLSLETEFPDKKEIVFLPYKASMWDSLESVWKRASEDPDCEAYVVPIPYYDKNPDGSFREYHYEGNDYPSYVPVEDYKSFDLRLHHPDEIYIHNPYDECNYVTSIEPAFYAKKLKECTEKLVYIPYFVLEEPDPNNSASVEAVSHFVTVPGVLYSDQIIVQSEAMKEAYIKALMNFELTKDVPREHWENKILGTGSPKFEKVLNTKKEELDIPKEWLKLIVKDDGTWKKVVFYNTSVAALLKNSEQMLVKMKDVFRIFYEYRDKITLLWRPHPLIPATIESMRVELRTEYQQIVEKYRAEGWGIYDDTPDLDRAIILCDAYYGDNSSVVQLCLKAGKPVMVQNASIL